METRRLAMPLTLFCAAVLVLPSWMDAQERGPLTPSPEVVAASPVPAARPAAVAEADTAAQGESKIVTDPPPIPVDQIIQKFAEKEAEFRLERDNFTYTQMFVIQTLDADGQPDGEYRMTSDILFTPEGKRYEKVTYAPASTLTRITMSQQDFDDLEHVQPFVLTTQELPKYDIKYVGKQHVDELNTYVFDVSPKKIEKGERYFQGRIWVDDKDLNIVKTDGKAVPDIRKKGQENVFPHFETFRENIEGHYWFPTYTRSNDTLHFDTGDVPIRMTVRYMNYKRFGVRIKITPTADKKP